MEDPRPLLKVFRKRSAKIGRGQRHSRSDDVAEEPHCKERLNDAADGRGNHMRDWGSDFDA